MANIPNINKTRISVVTKPTNISVSTAGVRGREQDLTNYAILNGGNRFSGSQSISGSLIISGESEFGGNIVPLTARGATLGTLERPFRDIFIQSASINIQSDTPGAPNTIISNVGGNLLISAGGMQLVGKESFIAATGSFQYLSGSFTHIGLQFNEGDIVTTGSLKVSGSTIQIGNNTQIGNNSLVGNTLLSGSVDLNGIFSFDNINTDNTATQVLVWNGITKRVGKQSGASNLDGGAAASVYLSVSEELNGGGA
jgi:cytoskeletal protein CcmA (bactofilin family)